MLCSVKHSSFGLLDYLFRCCIATLCLGAEPMSWGSAAPFVSQISWSHERNRGGQVLIELLLEWSFTHQYWKAEKAGLHQLEVKIQLIFISSFQRGALPWHPRRWRSDWEGRWRADAVSPLLLRRRFCKRTIPSCHETADLVRRVTTASLSRVILGSKLVHTDYSLLRNA